MEEFLKENPIRRQRPPVRDSYRNSWRLFTQIVDGKRKFVCPCHTTTPFWSIYFFSQHLQVHNCDVTAYVKWLVALPKDFPTLFGNTTIEWLQKVTHFTKHGTYDKQQLKIRLMSRAKGQRNAKQIKKEKETVNVDSHGMLTGGVFVPVFFDTE